MTRHITLLTFYTLLFLLSLALWIIGAATLGYLAGLTFDLAAVSQGNALGNWWGVLSLLLGLGAFVLVTGGWLMPVAVVANAVTHFNG